MTSCPRCGGAMVDTHATMKGLPLVLLDRQWPSATGAARYTSHVALVHSYCPACMVIVILAGDLPELKGPSRRLIDRED